MWLPTRLPWGRHCPRRRFAIPSPGSPWAAAVYVGGTLIAAFVSALAGLIIFGALAVYYLFEHLPSPSSEAEPGRRR